MVTNLINGESVFTELAQEWDLLAHQSMTNTPFQTLAYQQAWWQHLHPPEATLHTITVRDGSQPDAALIAIACFYLYDGILYFNGCVEETDYLDLIVSSEQAEAAWTAVFDCLCHPPFPDWTGMSLCNVPHTSPTRTLLPHLAHTHGFSAQERIQEVCPIIQLPATFDAYLDNIDSKQRREIQRKLRRANGANAQLIQIGPEDDIEEAVETFLALLQKSTLEKREWLNDGRRAVFHEVARAAQAAGTLQLLFIDIDGRKAAALFNFDYNNHTWVYNSGLDPSAFGKLSLGVVITARAIELAIEQGHAVFDFLRGNETYKYRFGAEDTNIYQLKVQKGGNLLE